MESLGVPKNSAKSVLLMIGGVVFALGWIALHLVWGMMALMANVMANDSGAASTDNQMILILGMLAGQVLAGSAGIPGGMVFFMKGKRKLLLMIFGGLFLTGAALQAGAFYYFFSTVS